MYAAIQSTKQTNNTERDKATNRLFNLDAVVTMERFHQVSFAVSQLGKQRNPVAALNLMSTTEAHISSC